MAKLTETGKTINCCHLTKLLAKVNQELVNSKSESEVIQLIYCALEKEGKLCKNCG